MSAKLKSIRGLLQIAEFELAKSENISSDYETQRKEILQKARRFKKEGLYDDDFMWELWGKRKRNGIASITSNNISKDEFQKAGVRELLVGFSHQIARGNTQTIYAEIVSHFEELKNKGLFQYAYRASIARVFCTFYPNEHINWVTQKNIEDIYKLFSRSFSDISEIDLSSKDTNWFKISYQLRQDVNTINVSLSKPLNRKQVRQIINLFYNGNIQEDDEKNCIDSPSTKRREVDLNTIHPHYRVTTGKTITVSQKEKELTKRFLDWIEKKKIYKLKKLEQLTGANDRIDASIQHGHFLIYAELKSVSSYSCMPKRAIRAALGQILDYQFYDRREVATELWIVLDTCELTTKDKEFIKSLNSNFKELNLKLLVEKNNSSFEIYK